MPPLTYIHASEAARTTAGGGGVDGLRRAKMTKRRILACFSLIYIKK